MACGQDVEIPGIGNTDIGYGCTGKAYDSWSDEPLELNVSHPNADFMALHFSKLNLPATDYIIITGKEIVDDLLNSTAEFENVTQIVYGNETSGEFVSNTFFTEELKIEVVSSTTPSENPLDACVGFQIDRYYYSAVGGVHPESTQETICGKDDSKNAACYKYLKTVYSNTNPIVRMILHKPSGSFYCTGWLVGCEGHMITNEHCINSQAEANSARYEFAAQGGSCSSSCSRGGACKGKVEATSATLLAFSKALDYALVKLNTRTNLVKKYGYLTMRESGPKLNERIYIPQHPSGWGKRIALKNEGKYSTITTLTRGGCARNQAGYFADTRGGSSGSPVLATKDNKVIALHHCGGKSIYSLFATATVILLHRMS